MREKVLFVPLLFFSLILFHPFIVNSQETPKNQGGQPEKPISIEHTDIIIRNISHEFTLSFKDPDLRQEYEGETIRVQVNGTRVPMEVVRGRASFTWEFSE